MARKKKTGTALVDWKAEMARYAEAEQETLPEAGSSNAISTRGGRLSFNGKELDLPLRVVIIDWALENSYYGKEYDSENIEPPDCFAIGKAKKNDLLVPAADIAPKVQSDACADCWANEFGSAERGRGKACGQRVRLLVAAADQLEAGASPDVCVLKMPPTRYDNFAGYAAEVTRVTKRPLFGVVTEVRMEYKNEGDAQKTPLLAYSHPLDDEFGEKVMALREKHDGDVLEAWTKASYELAKTRAKEKPKGGRRRAVKKKPVAKAAKKKATKKKGGGFR